MITKADIVLALVLLVLGLGSPFLLRSDSGDASRVIVTMDGKELGSYALSEDRPIAVTEEGAKELSGNDGVPGGVLNLIVIKGGAVHVEQANCKGQDCVKMGEISREGEVIACLPHKLLIEIAGGGEVPDVVIQ